MKRYKTKRELLAAADLVGAHDITYNSFGYIDKLMTDRVLVYIGYSAAKCGTNALLLRDRDSGDYYVVKNRTMALLQLI